MFYLSNTFKYVYIIGYPVVVEMSALKTSIDNEVNNFMLRLARKYFPRIYYMFRGNRDLILAVTSAILEITTIEDVDEVVVSDLKCAKCGARLNPKTDIECIFEVKDRVLKVMFLCPKCATEEQLKHSPPYYA